MKVIDVLQYLVNDRVIARYRRSKWRRKTGPFIHKGALGLLFELYPGEHIDSGIFLDGIFERRFLELLGKGLGHRRVLLDVGANIGNHALYLGDRFEHVHCFEPNPEAARRLRKNLSLNHVTKITVHEIGLGETSGSLPFSPAGPGHLGEGSFSHSATHGQVMLTVRRGDDYLAEQSIDDIDFIKVDVEGFEREVLRGLQKTIEQNRPIVAFEYHGHLEQESTFDEIAGLLPRYVFVDPVPPAPSAGLAKIAYGLRHGMQPQMQVISVPEARSYPAILAFPSTESFEEFRSAATA